MMYTKKLPPVRQLLNLAQHAQFPATCAELTRLALRLDAPETTIDFLKLYPADELFKSRATFMTRSEELEMLINQEQNTPPEILRGQQD